MGELLPAGADIAILIAAGFIYGLIWFATRNLSRLAKVIARIAPLGLVIPLMLFLAGAPALRSTAPAPDSARPDTTAQSPRPSPPERTATEEAARRPAEEERAAAERRLEAVRQAEERRRSEAEGARRGAQPEAPRPPPSGGSAAPSPAPPPPASGPPPGVPAQPQTNWDVVPVFYGTDRTQKPEPKRITYTSERASRLELGRALVTVPKSHQVPNIERPFAIRIPLINVTIYQQAEDPKDHFTIQELKALTREQFLAEVRKRVGGGTAFKDQAVVFVHGYNTDFDYALYRTAQMAYDLKFDGAAFLYSWPSGGGVMSYNYDRESSEQAEPYLRQFLELVMKESGAQSVSVIAHSMGNMPLLRVLQSLGPSLPPGVTLNQIILAAPDVDRNLFANLAANIKLYGRGVTLYCSNNDRAMAIARRVAGDVPRAGDVPADGPIVLAGIDTIDISQTSTDYLALNHSTYAERGALLNDIGLLLQTGERPPDKRIPILLRIATPKGDFWRYPPTTR